MRKTALILIALIYTSACSTAVIPRRTVTIAQFAPDGITTKSLIRVSDGGLWTGEPTFKATMDANGTINVFDQNSKAPLSGAAVAISGGLFGCISGVPAIGAICGTAGGAFLEALRGKQPTTGGALK